MMFFIIASDTLKTAQIAVLKNVIQDAKTDSS